MDGRRPVPLVGREKSLGELRETLRRAADGEPTVLLLSGETGVGKTRLIRALVEAEEPTVLYGACQPVAGDPLPFAPLTQALRRLGANGAVAQQVRRSPELARLVPSSAAVAPGAAGARPVDQSPTPTTAGIPTGASAQLGLFQAVLELVERLGAARPVLHVVEDIHWADRSTLDLLRFLATNLYRERVVLLASYRADRVIPGSLLAGWLAELARLPVTQRVGLDRLDPTDTAVLVAELLGGRPERSLLEATLARSAGNPLFVEHLVRHGSDDSGLPTTLHELLLARVTALPPPTQELLRAAAVLGRAAPIPLLAAALVETPDDVEARLRPALDQHVLELRRDDSVGFTHPAFGEVVYAGLLPAERTRLHRRAAEALEAGRRAEAATGGVDLVAGELARHWMGADDPARALDAAVAAGLAAERMYAFADAQASYARAAALTERVASPHDRGRLLSHAAQAAHLVGDSDEAIRLAEAALEVTEDPSARGSLCERLGAFHYLAGRGAAAEGWFRAALEQLPDGASTRLTARVYAGLGLQAATWSKLAEAEDWSARGLDAARASGARREEGMVLNALGVVVAARGHAEDGVDHLREALAIAREEGNPDDLAIAYINLSHVLAMTGRLAEVATLAREGGAVLTRMGLARQTGSVLKANACEALIKMGRLAEAADLVDDALAHEPRGIMAAPVLLNAGRLAMLAGDLQLARDRCSQARLIIETENAPDAWLREVIETAAEVELWAGRPGAAYDLALEGLQLVAGTDEEPFGGVLVGLGLRALADQAERHRDPQSRRRLEGQRHPLDHALATPPAAHAETRARQAWHRAEAARLALAGDPALWADAAEEWQALGQPFPAAYCRWREAEARLDAGADARAIQVLRTAYRSATTLGVPRLADELRRLAGWHRIDLVDDQPGDAADEQPDALAAYGLTEREVEVLGALAAGLTNREIARDLFISVKTASVHVSNILRKLDVSGRHEAARVAHRLGVGS